MLVFFCVCCFDMSELNNDAFYDLEVVKGVKDGPSQLKELSDAK